MKEGHGYEYIMGKCDQLEEVTEANKSSTSRRG